jgi:hypothetical protein
VWRHLPSTCGAQARIVSGAEIVGQQEQSTGPEVARDVVQCTIIGVVVNHAVNYVPDIDHIEFRFGAGVVGSRDVTRVKLARQGLLQPFHADLGYINPRHFASLCKVPLYEKPSSAPDVEDTLVAQVNTPKRPFEAAPFSPIEPPIVSLAEPDVADTAQAEVTRQSFFPILPWVIGHENTSSAAILRPIGAWGAQSRGRNLS